MVTKNQIKNLEKKMGTNGPEPVILIDNMCEPDDCYPFKSEEEKQAYIDSQIKKMKNDPGRVRCVSLDREIVERDLKEDGKL